MNLHLEGVSFLAQAFPPLRQLPPSAVSLHSGSPIHIEDRSMTINKFGWLNRPSRTTNPLGLRRNLSILRADADDFQQEVTVQQGVADMDASRAIAARIVPLDDSGEPGPETQIELNSCDRRGISFHHQLPLSARRALVSVEDAEFGRLEAEVSLSWCRFNRMGHYTSGGRFVQLAGKIA
jgi:hypothetical protein